MPTQHHTLKTETAYYQAVESGIKTFELRKNDRGFRVGDMVTLVEVVNGIPTGRELDSFEISYVLEGDAAERYGLMQGQV